MIEDLEGKMRGVKIVLSDEINFFYMGWGGCQFEVEGAKQRFNFEKDYVERVYNRNGEQVWRNFSFLSAEPANQRVKYEGLQVVLSDQVVYEGINTGAHHLSLLKDGNYVGHNHGTNMARDLSVSLVKAIFDKSGKRIWENSNLKPKR